MTASCAVLFPPINARLARLGGLDLPLPALILLPLLVVGVYDLITLKRLHRATMWFGFLLAADHTDSFRARDWQRGSKSFHWCPAIA